MKKRDWQNAFGPAPDAFRERVNETLMRLEEQNMRRRTKFSTTLIAAALIAALLAGAAFAASRLDIFAALNYADPNIPREGADELLSTDLAAAETDFFRVSVEQAVYDGYGAIVKLHFAPKDSGKYVLLANWAEGADVGEGYVTEREDCGDGIFMDRIVGREDGREIIWLSTPTLTVAGVDAPDAEALGMETLFNAYMERYNEDGSADFWISGLFSNSLPEALDVTLNVRGMNAGNETIYGEIKGLDFALVKSNAPRTARLVPADGDQPEHAQLIRGEISFTEVRGYLTAEFAWDGAEDAGMGVTLKLLDADGNPVNTGTGQCEALGDNRYLQQLELQSFVEIPETLFVEFKVIDESKTLGRVECRVEPVSE